MGQVLMHRAFDASAAVPDRIEALERSIAVSWNSEVSLRARVELARHYLSAGYLKSAYDEIREADRLAPNLGKIRLLRAAIAFGLHNLADAADSVVSYATKDPFDRQAYELWLRIAAAAESTNHPELTRAGEAIKLLEFAEEYETSRLTRDEARNFRREFLKFLRHDDAGLTALLTSR